MALRELLAAGLVLTATSLATAEEQAQPQQPVQEAKAAVTTTGIERADGERLSIAIGYYSRARANLLEALKAFDEARKYADPSVLIDPEEWRSTLVNRAEELERVMSPQPRASKYGVRFPSASQLLSTDQKKEEGGQ